jgi:cytochrome bd-type quinol oxidase subunit 2
LRPSRLLALPLAFFGNDATGFDFRNKFADARRRTFWYYALFAGGFAPSVVLGVAFGICCNSLRFAPLRLTFSMMSFDIRKMVITGAAVNAAGAAWHVKIVAREGCGFGSGRSGVGGVHFPTSNNFSPRDQESQRAR